MRGEGVDIGSLSRHIRKLIFWLIPIPVGFITCFIFPSISEASRQVNVSYRKEESAMPALFLIKGI